MEKKLKELKDFFNAEVIGSYMFVMENLLSIYNISDIDVVTDKDRLENMKKFLESKGYNCEQKTTTDGYNEVKDGYICKREGCSKPPFHIMSKGENFKILQFHERIAMKAKRLNKNDREQLKTIFQKLNNNLNINPNKTI